MSLFFSASSAPMPALLANWASPRSPIESVVAWNSAHWLSTWTRFYSALKSKRLAMTNWSFFRFDMAV